MDRLLKSLPDQIIRNSFYLLFFLVPLIMTPFNYELFEYNKMMATYGLTVIITGAWIIKMIVNRKIIFNRTPLDIPLVLFFISQIISTFLSIDRHISVWGYYSRFNGGLLSSVSYILLYYAFVSNFPREKIKSLIYVILGSGLLVSIYAVLEHFGIDKDIWVQDVQNRVFSTLGQPNWLGAYLAVLIPITVGLGLSVMLNSFQHPLNEKKTLKQVQGDKEKINIFNLSSLIFLFFCLLFYLTFIYTKSRSGFMGLWISLVIFWVFLFLIYKKTILKLFFILTFAFLFLNFVLGTPFNEYNKFTLPHLLTNNQPFDSAQGKQPAKPTGDSLIEVGVTESGNIRRIVWKGAVDIFKNNPLFGTGVETFAFAYYKYRPAEHNMTSEWDFLYNKAHNEYLNYAATTGAFGLGSYLLIILVFIFWAIRTSFLSFRLTEQSEGMEESSVRVARDDLIFLSLFISWISILITNFFGFSVVLIQLFFFLIPAILFVLINNPEPALSFEKSHNNSTIKQYNNLTINNYQLLFSLLLIFIIFYLLYLLLKLWYADILFARGYHLSRSQEYSLSYTNIRNAILLNKSEPFYYDELVIPAIQLSGALESNKQSSLSADFKNEAIGASDFAVSSSPSNVNYWKTRTRLFYALSADDEKYTSKVLEALTYAKKLSPTDPKITYNLALIYDKTGDKEKAYGMLEETIKLKPDYRDAYFAQALFYIRDRQKDKAREALNFILTKLNPNDEDAKKKLEELK